MTLRTKYILFILLLHLTALVLSFFVFQKNKLLFLGAEVVILLSVFFSVRLYRALVRPVEFIARGADAILDQDFHVKFKPVGQTEMDRLIEVYNHMIDELRRERAQKAQQHFLLEKLIEKSPTGIIMLDLDGRIESANPKALTLLSLPAESLIGAELTHFDSPLARALSDLTADSTTTVELNGIETYKCHKAHFIDRGFPKYFLLIEELTAEKLAIEKQAYGHVIRMMAHEVNNSIGPINSILHSLQAYAPQLPPAEQYEFSHAIRVATERNDKLNAFMRNYADVVRLPAPLKETTDLRPLVADITDLMRYQTAGKTIDFILNLPNQPVPVDLDVRQMEQVLINVLKNAIEAIEQTGTIRVQLTTHPTRLSITDTGAGIPPEHRSRLFSSFFSTKPQGQGVGLTLVREILLNHGFGFSLGENAEGETEFWVGFEVASRQ